MYIYHFKDPLRQMKPTKQKTKKNTKFDFIQIIIIMMKPGKKYRFRIVALFYLT